MISSKDKAIIVWCYVMLGALIGALVGALLGNLNETGLWYGAVIVFIVFGGEIVCRKVIEKSVSFGSRLRANQEYKSISSTQRGKLLAGIIFLVIVLLLLFPANDYFKWMSSSEQVDKLIENLVRSPALAAITLSILGVLWGFVMAQLFILFYAKQYERHGETTLHTRNNANYDVEN